MNYKLVIALLMSATLGCATCCAQDLSKKGGYYNAPFEMKILKHQKPKNVRFRDIRGRFQRVKVELVNTDRVEHALDYTCFYLVDELGYEYEAHFDATLIKESEVELMSFSEEEYTGFVYEKMIGPRFSVRGWLLFLVPTSGEFELKFRGYKHINKH